MRSWFQRHPNVTLVTLAVLWIVQIITIGWHWRQHHWFLVAIGTVCAAWISVALERWWNRT